MSLIYIILPFLLKDLRNRSEAKLKQISADPRKCLATLFEFIPMSGKTINKLDEIETSKYGIENFGSVGPIELMVSGVLRKFDVNMYGIYKVLMCFVVFLTARNYASDYTLEFNPKMILFLQNFTSLSIFIFIFNNFSNILSFRKLIPKNLENTWNILWENLQLHCELYDRCTNFLQGWTTSNWRNK